MPTLPLAALLCALAFRPPAPAEFAFFRENVLGTSFELRVRSKSEAAARRAEDLVLAEINRLAAILSNHNPSSQFRRWQLTASEWTPIAPELASLLAQSESWRVRTAGAFDPRVELLIQLWKEAERLDRVPTDAALRAARAQLALPAYAVDAEANRARRLTACPLTLDGIAKGDILERACRAALESEKGIHGLLLNVGGDIRACGNEPWIVAIAPTRSASEAETPVTFVRLRNASLSTSGSAHRGFQIQGRWYSHILDPRTGMPATRISAAAVLAPTGADADALATAANILDPAQTLALAASLPDVQCLVIPAGAEPIRSLGFPLLEQDPKPAESTDPAEPFWGDTHELAVHFEINTPPRTEGGYRRPYVVIWVEDPEGHAVRTVILWVSLGGSGPDRWLPDLNRWFRGDQVRSLQDKKNMVYSIARPTRQPGKYTVIWDGTDDHKKPLPPGEYTLFIEAAREHGTHQLIRTKVQVGAVPFTEELKGNVEIKSAQVEYRPKSADK
jgi:thiamine biosynthesis lipoprotein ApbE